ncbi:2-amino-4-hydroxy-6-hydroxymethyldihydropteridine diphosphokinase [Candidatus Bipolaricaulota bacterium]|nr:2-amino-4-hydroxy-6-hydroxymethyldihydropteridine diphosphokinase [Candidatus Bipolaricaulota bacterium]
MVRAFVGLGSNLGDRKANIANSLQLLSRAEGIHLIDRSSNYETEPIGPTQPWFINSAIEIQTSLSPEDLLDGCKEVEKRIGRVDSLHWGPRLVDLDLLLYGDRVIEKDNIDVPHSQMAKRKFVLLPLLELDSELIHPKLGRPLKELLTKTEEDKKVIKIQ